MKGPTPLQVYASLLRRVPRLYVDAFAIYSAIFALPALILFFNRPLAEKLLHWQGLTPWLGLIPVLALLGLLLLRANFEAHSKLHLALQEARQDARALRDRLEAEPTQPRFRLLSKPLFWKAVIYPLNRDGQPAHPEGDWYKGDPPIRLILAGPFKLAAYGGSKGGILHSLAWSLRNCPNGFRFIPPTFPALQAFEPNKAVADVGTVTLICDHDRLSTAERMLMDIQKDPVLVATYRVDGSEEVEALLPIPAHYFLQAFRYAGVRGPDAPPVVAES